MSEYDSELSKIVAELNRAAPSQKPPAARMPQSTASLDQLLHTAAGRGASDVLLIAGAPAMLRINGALASGTGPALEAEDVRSLVLPLLEPWQLEELQKKSVDLSFMREGLGRFRDQHPPPARHAGGQHPAAAFAHSVARIAAPAGVARQTGRAAAGAGAGDRADRLREDLHAGGAHRPGQHAAARRTW